MGHSTATIVVKKENVAPAESRANTYSTWMPFRNSLEERILSAALQIWHQEEADRHDSQNAGDAKLMPPMPEELAIRHIDDMVTARGYNHLISPVIPLVDSRDYEKKEKKISIVLDDAEWREYVKGNGYEIMPKKIAELMPEQKDMVLSFSIDGQKGYVSALSTGWTLKSVVEADASGGKAKTVYQLVADGKAGTKEYDSQALARAAAVQLVKTHPDVLEIDVVAKVVREDNTALVKVRRVVRSATAKVTVTYVKMKTATPRTDGWLVGFDYHH